MSEHITHDPAYETVPADDFASMIEVPRYARRSDAFDDIIAATHDHFWDPLDRRYLDFSAPFDLARETVLPREQVIELQSAVADRLDEAQEIALANEVAVSAFLAGRIGFTAIPAVIEHTLGVMPAVEPTSLAVVESADVEAREVAAGYVAAAGRQRGVRSELN